MKIEIIGTNYTPTQTLKNLIEKKAEKLECFFKDDTTAKFVCSQSGAKERYTLEATIWFNGDLIRVEEVSDNMYDNAYAIFPKIERMVRKYRTKLNKKLKETAFDGAFMEEDISQRKPEVVKVKQFGLKGLTKEEAMADLEMSGYDFYLYLNVDTGMVNCVYRRHDGNVGIIECVY